ncbi:MAG: DUF2237 domain-containing protein [Thiobacillaceae bacterium]
MSKSNLESSMDNPVNVLGEALKECSQHPITGFYRDGSCHTGPQDIGLHGVCVLLSEEFLAFSQYAGNDLSTPMPEFGFPGLKAGNRWCLCASRWQQALDAGYAPKVVLTATHETSLKVVRLEDLKAHAVDLN